MRTILAATAIFAAYMLAAEPICIGEVCYPSREAAIAAGALPADKANADHPATAAGDDLLPTDVMHAQPKVRVAFGYMRPAQFISFLRGEEEASPLADRSVLVVFLLVLLGGMLANLTPCVLPLVPVNVAILLGRGESTRASRLARGFAYGAGMAAAYGALGLAAAFGGMAFGSVQSSAWFNAAAAAVFVVLGLGMLDVVNIDVAVWWRRWVSKGRAAPSPRPSSRGLGGAFLLGAGAAVLAGACVQPILMAMLVYTADGFAAGRWWTISLPFVLGAGMGLPWMFVAGGLSVLPRPGAWMVWVKRGFAIVIFAMAAWYAYIAWTIWRPKQHEDVQGESKVFVVEATPETWREAFAKARPQPSGSLQDVEKPILVDIWATWCKNCLAMEKTTLRAGEVEKELSRFNVIRLQAEDLSDLAKVPELSGLGIKGIPAFVMFE